MQIGRLRARLSLKVGLESRQTRILANWPTGRSNASADTDGTQYRRSQKLNIAEGKAQLPVYVRALIAGFADD